jgi:hypothetical protein
MNARLADVGVKDGSHQQRTSSAPSPTRNPVIIDVWTHDPDDPEVAPLPGLRGGVASHFTEPSVPSGPDCSQIEGYPHQLTVRSGDHILVRAAVRPDAAASGAPAGFADGQVGTDVYYIATPHVNKSIGTFRQGF